MPQPAFLSPAPPPRARRPRRARAPRCAAALPPTYTALRADAVRSTQAALAAGERLLEVQFPPVPNMATAALNELLDANRAFARDFLSALTPRYPRGAVVAVFPDRDEARLAAAALGATPFAVAAIPRADTPAYVSESADGLVAVVNPGFNIDEWINMENLEGLKPLVALNADLDKVRGGYYPKLFYPGLHKVKTRFLSRFVAVYYVKQFSNGGTLLRAYPDPWTLFYQSLVTKRTEVLYTSEERPDFVHVERLLSARRVDDMSSK